MTGPQLLDRTLAADSLPSLNPLALRLMEMAADEGSDLKAMAHLIEGDPGSMARLLKLVNSAVYRRGSAEVTNIGHALNLLGLAEVRYIALSTSLTDTLPTRHGGPNYHLFWPACWPSICACPIPRRSLPWASSWRWACRSCSRPSVPRSRRASQVSIPQCRPRWPGRWNA